MADDTCAVCGAERHAQASACSRCARILDLIDDDKRWRDHRYLVFEHRPPGGEAGVVVTCALVNRMKTDLTEQQF